MTTTPTTNDFLRMMVKAGARYAEQRIKEHDKVDCTVWIDDCSDNQISIVVEWPLTVDSRGPLPENSGMFDFVGGEEPCKRRTKYTWKLKFDYDGEYLILYNKAIGPESYYCTAGEDIPCADMLSVEIHMDLFFWDGVNQIFPGRTVPVDGGNS